MNHTELLNSMRKYAKRNKLPFNMRPDLVNQLMVEAMAKGVDCNFATWRQKVPDNGIIYGNIEIVSYLN